MIHIIVGDYAAEKLMAAFEHDENLKGEVLVLKDTLGIGPLKPEEGESFSEMRTKFWKTLVPNFEDTVQDHEALVATIEKAKQDEEPLCFWMAPCVSDVMAYYWLLTYCKPYPEMLHVISINGLPFFNEKGSIFYPNNFSQVVPTEFTKTKRLLKEVSPADYETDGDEWERFVNDATWVRIHEGSKKIASKEASYFDTVIKATVGNDFQKANKVVNESMKKITQTLSHHYIEWRIRELVASGELASQGDLSKTLKDFEVKKVGSTEVVEA